MNIKQVRRCKKNIPNILNNDDEDDKKQITIRRKTK
jgi:hypothetical protein